MIEALGIKGGPRLIDKIFFRMSSPWHPTLLFIPISALLVWLASHYGGHGTLTLIGFFLLGMFGWTIVEYFLHRFVFHWTTVREPIRRIVSGLHLDHHRDTENKYFIFPPLMASVLISSVIYLVFFAITMSFTRGALLLAGLTVAYVIYEWMHYGAHQYRPKDRIFKYMRKYHLAHHFKNPKKWYGVTTPLWDLVFGTYKKI